FGFEDPYDDKPDGWGEKGSPVLGVDPSPLVGYFITKFKDDGTIDQTCGVSVTDTDPANYTGVGVDTGTPDIDVEKLLSVDGGPWMDVDDAPGPEVAHSSDVRFRFEVTNTGTEDLVDLTLTDTDFDIPASEVPSELAIGGSFAVEIGPFDPSYGEHVNVATVEAVGAGGIAPHTYDGVKIHYTFILADGSVLAGSTTGDGPVGFPSGEGVHFSCSDDFGFDDDDPTNDGWSDGGNAPVQGIDPPITEFLMTHFKSDGTIDKTCGYFEPPVTDSDPAHYVGIPGPMTTPDIDVEKELSVDGGPWMDVDDAPGPDVANSSTVAFRFIVTNTGDEDLTDITLTDTDFDIPAAQVPNDLAVGGSFTVEIGPFNPIIGEHQNTATVEAYGVDDIQPHVYDGVKIHYTFLLADGSVLSGSTTGDGPVGFPSGEDVHFSCSDDFGFDDDDPTNDGWSDGSRAPVQGIDPPIVEFLMTHFKSDGTIDKTCGYQNPPVTDSDPAHYTGLAPQPGIALEKYVSVDGGTTWDEADAITGPEAVVGDDVFFRFMVTNVGEVTLTDLTLTDDVFSVPSAQVPASLAPGASYEVVIGPFAAEVGQHKNTATATGTGGGADGHTFPGNDDYVFTFLLADGTLIEGTSDNNEAEVGLSDAIHVSCSDDFGFEDPNDDKPDGWGEKGAPVFGVDPGPIVSYQITRYRSDGTIYKTCGNGDPFTGETLTVTDPAHYIGLELGSIGDRVWFDTDQDGVQDAGELGLPGVRVTLHDETLAPITSTTTDSDGLYLFDDLRAGTYHVSFELPTGFVFSPQNAAGDEVDSDVDPNTGIAGPIDLGKAEDDPTWDAGMYLLEPAIDIEKLTNGVQSDSGPGELIQAGSTVTWTYIVTNTGNTTLYDIEVNDSVEGFICSIDSLDPAATNECEKVGEAKEGAYGNLADVVGTDVLGTEVTDEDPSHYIGYNVGIDLEKFVQGRDADTPTGPYAEVGDPVRFTFLVNNTGTLDLANVTVTDDVFGNVCTIDLLEAGLVHICEIDVPAELGQHKNTATVEGQPVTSGGAPIGAPVTDTDPAHYIGWVGAIDIEKSTNGEDADFGPGPFIPVGGDVEWIYVVTNNSSVDLINVTVTDDEIGQICVIPFLAANGGTDTCSATGTAILGQYDNIGIVKGIPVDPAGNTLTNIPVTDEDPSHYVGFKTGIEIIKKVEGDDANTPTGPTLLAGTQALFTFDVTNTGTVALSDVVVTDDVYGDICVIADLAAGLTDQCELLVTVELGQHTNIATAAGQPVDPDGNPLGDPIEDDDPANYFGTAPSIDIEKATNGLDSDDAPGAFILEGTSVRWTYVITNTGNVPLDNVVVTDNQGLVPVLIDQGDGDDVLAIGETWTYEAFGTAELGEYANLGSVLARDLDGVLVGDNDPSHYTGYSAAIRLIKKVEGEDANAPTGPYVEIAPPPADFPTQVTFSFEVFNDGSSDLANVVIDDDMLGAAICSFDLIPAGESRTCELSADAVAGQHTNIATATGQPVNPAGDPLGGPLSDDDPANYFGWFSGIDLEKLTNGLDSDDAPGELIVAGSTVTWTYEVTNTGNVDLANVLVQDDQEGIICVIDLLAAGATDDCSAQGIAQAGQYANIADVAGTPVNDGDVLGPNETDVDPSHYFGTDPMIDISKNAEGEDSQTIEVGSSVTFTIRVENTGNVPLTDVSVLDVESPSCDATYTDNGGVL
ncbi:MAG: hypothetical protein HKN93_09555, partial [Acidimicrobiia bacterium]|nr:hypothetical protein [Acidimicrobiia bacterium]